MRLPAPPAPKLEKRWKQPGSIDTAGEAGRGADTGVGWDSRSARGTGETGEEELTQVEREVQAPGSGKCERAEC